MAIGKNTIFLLLILCILTIPALTNEIYDNVNPVEKIIQKYIQAIGSSALAEIKTEKKTGTLLRGASGQVPLEIIAKAPGKWRYTQTFAWGDQVCYGFDGATAWVQDTKNISKMSARQLLDLQLMFDVQAPLKMHEWYQEMEIKGTEKVGDREAITITATSQAGFSTELAFDRETGVLLRAGDIVFEDYRDVGSVKRPFRILLGKEQGEKHRQMKMLFSEIRHNLNADDSLFQAPDCALPFKEAPLYKSRKQVEVSIEALEACVGVYQHLQDPEVTFTVTRQQNHLMVKRTGWSQKIEIKPESETDYFIRFLGWEFHFIKDAAGRVTHVEIVTNQAFKAEKIK